MENEIMTDIVKYVITDSSGSEHIFNETDEQEIYLDLRPEVPAGDIIQGFIKITIREFKNGSEKYTGYDESLFYNPLRIDIIYSAYTPSP